MVTKSSKRAWIGGLAALAAVLMLVAVSDVVSAGSKDDAKKGYLGVFMQELDKDVREGLDLDVKYGVLISDVEEDSPADKAGIESRDVLIEFNGKKVDSPDDLSELVADTEVGQEVEIKVIREGKQKTLKLVVGERPDDFGWLTMGDLHFDSDDFKHVDKIVHAFSGRPRLGVEVRGLNEDLAPYFKTKAGEGVLVLEVKDESVAEEAGIKSGDVIQKVGDEPISSVDDLLESLEDFEEGDEVAIQLMRKGKKTTVTATMDEPAGHFMWSGKPNLHQFRVPKVHFYSHEDDLKVEMELMKKELKEMKKELKELKKQ
jgi:serine protease Do